MQHLENLNPKQLEAVNAIDGPVMVVAGPGTGKTQILAARIANILQQTDSSAQNILCLTYTDAGTIAMRKRLVQLIGNEAHRVSIHTFHGFCNRVIQENPQHFDYKNLDPVGDLEAIEFITDIAINLDESHPLKKMKGNVANLVKSLRDFFDWMKRENISVEKLEKLTTEKKEEIRNSEQYRYKRKSGNNMAGDLKMKEINEIDDKLDQLNAAGSLYPIYQDILEKNNRYDYTDMILWVIDLFSKNSYALARYQEQFHYILVDEYQDTSGSQNDLLHLLLNYWDAPNAFVVGDDDQSIYRFQGAEVKNIVDFAVRYKNDLQSVVLTENYRSTQHILNAAKALIDQNEDRIIHYIGNIDKNLTAALDAENKGQKVKIVEFENEYHEALWVAEQIKNKINEGSSPSDFAVIYKNHKHGEVLAKMLKSENIPVFLKRSENVLKSVSVEKLVSILRFLAQEVKYPFSADLEFFRILHFSQFEIEPLTLARLSYYLNKNQQPFKSWRDFLNQINTISTDFLGISPQQKENVSKASKLLESYISMAATESVFRLVTTLVVDLKISDYAMHQNHFVFELESVVSFLNFVENEANLSDSFSVHQLIEKIDLMNQHYIFMSKENVVYDKSGVNFTTAHSSKGLEFKTVFVLRCNADAWEKERARNTSFNPSVLLASDNKMAELQEKRRLFYVAMTRAETELYLTHFQTDKKGKEIARSEFLDAVEQATASVVCIKPEIDFDMAAQKINAVFAQPQLVERQLLDAPFLDEYLQNYKLSVSHLNTYLECPTTFYFQNILRVPSAKNVYMSFGTAIHNSLDQIMKIFNQNQEEATTKKLTDLYEFYLKKERAVFSDKLFKDFLSLGKNILAEYLPFKIENWKTIEKIETEVVIDRVEIDGVPIKGQLDKIEISGNTANVVDYKTGSFDNAKNKLKPPVLGAEGDIEIEKQFGGSYWRQIMFYSLLLDYDKTRNLKMISGEMDFVEPIETGEFTTSKIVITSENQYFMRNVIKNTYQNILQKKFSPGCGKEDCHWCNFISNHYD
ncbi:MAG: ATP-dependent helicase [Flavobacteriales bacterium]|nr:ATP-dependent helicase [Flavobacteriales bacterium]